MLHFPKVIQLRQIKNKGLINYCENAAYCNTSPSLSIKKAEKEQQQQQQKSKTELSLPIPTLFISVSCFPCKQNIVRCLL